MTTSNDFYTGLPLIQTEQAIDDAISRIDEERSGEQHGLYCRWEAVNRGMLKYWRFRHVTLIAGMSGSGKSYFLNMLRQDFLDVKDVTYRNISAFNLNPVEELIVNYDANTKEARLVNEESGYYGNAIYYPSSRLIKFDNQLIHKAINRDCIHKVICIHFGYEMDAADELLRSASNVLGKSYGYLMSSQWDKDLNAYARVTDIERNTCAEVLESFRNRKEFYVATSGNVNQMYDTIAYLHQQYPDHKFIVSLDHTLLSKKLNESSDNDLHSSIAIFGIKIRTDFDAMFIPLGQLNQNIEADERVLKNTLHYPGKKDIHCGAAMWWACDNVIINHRPETLNIEAYGPHKLRTKHLLHSGFIKSRKGVIGNVWLREAFSEGRIHDATKEQFT